MPRVRTASEVTNFELFYDLIFAYAISKISAVLHVTQHGQINLVNMAEFLMMTLVFWSIWTYQTVYANRFFRENLSNIGFLLFDMFWVVVLSQSLTTDFAATQLTFGGSTAMLFLSLAIQYLLVAWQNPESAIRQLCFRMGGLLLAVGVIDLIASSPMIPFRIEFPIYAATILVAAFFPLIMHRTLFNVPTQFQHLTERYSLFVLLLFGEGVIAVASLVHVHRPSGLPVLFFAVLVLLFAIYNLTYQSGLNRAKQTAGFMLIHMHYFVFVATLWFAASLELYLANELQKSFFVAWFDISLWGFIIAVTLTLAAYPRVRNQVTIRKGWQIAAWLVIWLPISWLSADTPWLFMILLIVYLALFLYYWWRCIIRAN